MVGYERDELEEYDDYDMEGEYGDEGLEAEEEEEGEEYEEEEARQPTQEEIEYLELRQRLKESIRRNRKQGGSGLSAQEKEKKLPYNNFGSFFGPSQPVIAQRVIEESKSLLENQHLVSKMLNSSQSSKRSSSSNCAGSKLGHRVQVTKATSELRKKVEKLKNARDYSFLSDDAEIPALVKEPPPRKVSVPTSEAQSVQMLPKSKQPLASNSNSGRKVHDVHEERKKVPMNGQMHSKAGSYKSSPINKPNTSVDSKKLLNVSNGTGPGRPVNVTNGVGPRRPVNVSSGMGPGRPGMPKAVPKVPPSRMPIAKTEKKISAAAPRNLPPSAQRAPPSKLQSSDSRKHLELKKGLQDGIQERRKDKITSPRPAISSKPQPNKPEKQLSTRSHSNSNSQRPKKRQMSEDEKALMMIRNMFHTDRYAVCDEDDVSDMEANWDEIMKEERRSAKIARQEDEEQLRLIEEEERRERMRKMKKRKLSQH